MTSQEMKKTLWEAADKLRAQMDAAEYKHLVLGLIFLKYVSDAFDERRREVAKLLADPTSELFFSDDPTEQAKALEDRDYYSSANVFWVPQVARWETLRNQAKQPEIGRLLDDALVAMLSPHKGRIYDPCCGSGGMFVQSEKFIEAHGGRADDISIYGQESNPTTWRLVAMNLAIRGIGFNLGKEPVDTFTQDQHGEATGDYADVSGFCRSVKLEEIQEHGYVLTPGRYVGAEAVEDDDEAFAEKMERLTAQLAEQMARGAELDAVIRRKLGALGYGI